MFPSSGRWRQERHADHYYKRAKKEGRRSRAAYKLLQVNSRHPFIEEGDVVVDLGCAPGGWLQVAADLVGVGGRVLGVDLKEVEPLPFKNIETMIGDVRDTGAVSEFILARFGDKVDAVLSDASPNISGVWEVDQARQLELAQSAFAVANSILRRGGSLFIKVFDGPEVKGFVSRVRVAFNEVKTLKPEASRARSSEIFILSRGFRG